MINHQKKKGFTLVEAVVTTLLISITCLTVAKVVISVNNSRMDMQNTVYLSNHNLNCMERLRQMARDTDGMLLDHYGSETFGTNDFDTNVDIETVPLGDYFIYYVDIQSSTKTNGRFNKAEDTFIMTNIGEAYEA